MSAKVFFTAIAQPDTEVLRDFVFLCFGELIVEFEREIAFSSAGRIAMSIPESLRCSKSPTSFFDECLAF